MLPLFPFIAGLVAGAATVSLYQNRKAQDGFKGVKEKLKQKSTQARKSIRHATVSGLNTLESSTVRLRDRLQATPEAPVPEKETVSASSTLSACGDETCDRTKEPD